jgi:hypothetical protein
MALLLDCLACGQPKVEAREEPNSTGFFAICHGCGTTWSWRDDAEPAVAGHAAPASVPVSVLQPMPDSPGQAEPVTGPSTLARAEPAASRAVLEVTDVTALPRERRRYPQRRPRPGYGVAGIAAGLAASLAIAAVFLAREAIMSRLPFLERGYRLVGLPRQDTAVSLVGIGANLEASDGQTTLVVEGDIANSGKRRAQVPRLLLVISDAAGRPIHSWQAEAPTAELAPGQVSRFRAKLATPPLQGRKVVVRFVATAALKPANRTATAHSARKL